MFELNQIYCGDCLELMKELDDNSVDLVVTDIPYNEVNRDSNGLRCLDKGVADSSLVDLDVVLPELNRVSKYGFYIFCGTRQFSTIDKFMVVNDISRRCIVWEKTNPSPMNGEYIWLSGVELCVYGKKKGMPHNSFCQNTVLKYPCGSSKYHPTEKPLDLMKKLITVSSNRDDLVLDPFAGSGTTLVAAKELGRKFIGFEIEQKYVDIAKERLKQEVLNL